MERRGRISTELVMATGIVLSVALAVAFYMTQSLAPAFATFAGLLGLILTLQLEILIGAKHNVENMGRMGSMITKIEANPWLPDLVESILYSTEMIEQNHAGTPAVEVSRGTLERCRRDLADLELGRFTHDYADNSLVMQLTEKMQEELFVTSFLGLDLEWWYRPEGQEYWRLQDEAIRRGVRVRRVFIHDGWSQELDQLARRQREAGAAVKCVHRDDLPSSMRVILALWDHRCGLEVLYNANGEGVRYAFTVARVDVERLRQQFELIERAAVDIDHVEADPAGREEVSGSPPAVS